MQSFGICGLQHILIARALKAVLGRFCGHLGRSAAGRHGRRWRDGATPSPRVTVMGNYGQNLASRIAALP